MKGELGSRLDQIASIVAKGREDEIRAALYVGARLALARACERAGYSVREVVAADAELRDDWILPAQEQEPEPAPAPAGGSDL